MKELTLRAVLLGLVMSVVLGAANAYLGLHAGQTIAATYPAGEIVNSAEGVSMTIAFSVEDICRCEL